MSGAGNNGVLCAGRVYCDLIFTGLSKFPALGEEQFATGLSLHAGGGAYITAAYLSALARPVSLLSTLPGGPFSSVIQAEIDRNGINTECCVCADGDTDPQLTVAMVMAEERAFLTRRSGNALPVPELNWSDFQGVTHLHIGELATLLEYPSLVTDAQGAGITVSVDCGWDDELFTRPDVASCLQGVDVFLPNQAEYDQLTDRGFIAEMVSVCVIKRGASGAVAHVGGSVVSASALPAQVVDTTGAGDAFNAGFIHGWLQQKPVDVCLELGNSCGARAVASIGGAIDLETWSVPANA